MPNIDSFSSQIVAMVRNMPDDAILELVLHKLTSDDVPAPKAAVPPTAAAPQEASPPTTKPKKRTARRRTRASKTATQPKPATKPAAAKPAAAKPAVAKTSNPSKDALLAAVEKTIKVSNGLGLAAISAVVGEPKTRVSAAILELKNQKKIFQAGDRRFARYAGDLKTAKAATISARTGGL